MLCALSLMACQEKKAEGYTISGTLKGDAEGARIMLLDEQALPPVKLDSAIVKDGKFSLKGKIDAPAMYSLIIDINEPGTEQPDYRNKKFKVNFYLENSDITWRCSHPAFLLL